MVASRWNRVEELFHEAADLSPDERKTFLQQVCDGDDELRREVESLLDKDVPEDEFRRGVVEPVLEQLPESKDKDSELTGHSIGPYLITRLIGKGGMGAVYQAVRGGDFYMQVAIKLLKRGTDTESALNRFRSERQILAELQHPNIAHLLDGGVTESGLPYFVMEYVDGTPLLEYSATLPIHRRLEHFRAVCAAVHYAHQHRVVHRDIKPGNILVTQDGVPKLLDFGIAKLLSLEDSNTEPPSSAGFRLMTPDYASPEQVRGQPVTAATDIYSLGAVLYELLTGQCPIHLQTRSLIEIEKEVCSRVPKKPSSINKELDPDLDYIVLMAMQKEPARRYPSAEDLADDLDCFLHDLPVKARKESALYRTSKLLKRKRQLIAAAALPALFVVALVAGLRWLGWPGIGSHPPALHGSVVIADFVNKTGDPVFDDTLKTALTVALNQSPFLDVLSDNKVAATLKLMTRPANTKLTPDIVRELCMRADSKAYITGSIVNLDDEYVIGLKAVNCRTSDTLAQEQVTANGKEKVLNALGDAAVKLRGKLGESLASVQKFDVPLEQATTSSLEALQAYSMGVKIYQEKGADAALVYDQRAIQLDPNFAMGYAQAAVNYFILGEIGLASEYSTKAFELREHASERERLIITSDYFQFVTGELDKAAQVYQQLIENYLQYPDGYIGLGDIYGSQGKYEKAVEVTRPALQLAPERVDPFGNLASYLLALQRLDEARQIIREAQERKLDDSLIHYSLYGLAFLAADASAMTQEQQWFADHPAVENFGLALDSDSYAYAGHLSKARERTQQAVNSAMRADSKETGAIWWENAALREAAFGNSGEAKQAAAQGLKLYLDSQGVQVEAALADAMAGNTARAQSTAQDLNRRYPLDTQVQSLWLPAIQGQVALNRKAPAEAIEHLQRASPPVEYGAIQFNSQISCLYPTYLRGQAYLATGQGKEAVAEFQKILDHSGIVWNCWTGALARLGVARAYALDATKDPAARDKARTVYREFLTLWKDADSDIPILKQARAEYAKLQ